MKDLERDEPYTSPILGRQETWHASGKHGRQFVVPTYKLDFIEETCADRPLRTKLSWTWTRYHVNLEFSMMAVHFVPWIIIGLCYRQ